MKSCQNVGFCFSPRGPDGRFCSLEYSVMIILLFCCPIKTTEYVFIGKLDFKRVSDVYECVGNSWKTMVLGQTTGEDFIEMEK